MAKFKMKLTKVATVISTAEVEVELPTDDAAKAIQWAEVDACWGQYSSHRTLRPYWEAGEETVVINAEIMPDTAPDFAEVDEVILAPPERPVALGAD
jgi:hypothetical protein